MATTGLRFSANLSMLFNEVAFVDRFALARSESFDAVEFLFPYEYELDEIRRQLQRHALGLVLFDVPPGDSTEGEFGLLGCPGKERRFRESFAEALDVAACLNCSRINVLFGNLDRHCEAARQLECALRNLRSVIPRAEDRGICLLVEALNPVDFPNYFLHDTPAALDLVQSVDHPAVRLQYDIYHATMAKEDVLSTLDKHVSMIGHVQIADVPGRHEPGSGSIDYAAVFDRLMRLRYDGYVGLEYAPSRGTAASLRWLSGYRCGKPRARDCARYTHR